MTILWNGLRDFPGTQAKVFVGVVLEILTVLAMLYVLVAGKTANMNLEFVITLCGFVLGVNGVTTWQYGINRKNDPDVIAARAQGPSPITLKDPAQVNIEAGNATELPKVEVQPLLSQPVARRMPVPLTHRESEKD